MRREDEKSVELRLQTAVRRRGKKCGHSAMNCQRYFSSKLCFMKDLFCGILFNISCVLCRIDLVFSQSIFLYVVGLGVFIRHQTLDLGIAGSSPVTVGLFISIIDYGGGGGGMGVLYILPNALGA